MLFITKIIPISVIIIGFWIAAADSRYRSSKPEEKTCGKPRLKRCMCVTKDPCEPVEKSHHRDYPMVDEKQILTKEKVKKATRHDGDSITLDLTDSNFEAIDKNAFDESGNLSSLDLAHNDIVNLPAFIFSKLENLDHLSLAENGLRVTKNAFADLGNLKTLNLSSNPLNDVLDDNCFYGLTHSCDILVKGVSGIKKIGSNAFGDGTLTPVQNSGDGDIRDEEPKPKSVHRRSAPFESFRETSSKSFRPRICIKENRVQMLTTSKGLENPNPDCKSVVFRYRTLNFEGLGIATFEKGWYTLPDKEEVPDTLSVINLSNNNILRVTSDVVNVLPEYITWLDLNGNKIERLEKETFVHPSIFSLNLDKNSIAEIEDHTFKMPKLYQMEIRDNQLKNTKFAATLPASLVSLDLENNHIVEITPNSFGSLGSLRYLNVKNNRITTLQSQSLKGPDSLGQLLMAGNRIETIEPGTFDNIGVWQLFLQDNNIQTIQRGVFTTQTGITQLELDHNKLTVIERGAFDLPRLEILDLSFNNISVIEKGALRNSRKLERLDLSQNPIKKLENGALFGMDKTKKCYVSVAKTPIEVIQGGVFDDL